MCRQASERIAQHGCSASDPGKSHGHVTTPEGVWPGRAGPTLILATRVSLAFFVLFNWQLNRGLNEGSVVLAREAFRADGIEGLYMALWSVFDLGGRGICLAPVSQATIGPCLPQGLPP